MAILLERALKAIKSMEIKKGDRKIAEKWLGVFGNVIPESMTSTEYLKKMRESGYGKY